MLPLIQLFYDICRFQRQPQDVPYSHPLLYLCVSAYVITSYFSVLLNPTPVSPFVTVILDTALLLALGYGSVWVRGFDARATQTVTALAGTGVVFGLISLPLSFWVHGLPPDQALIPMLLIYALTAWNIAVIGHIIRHALALPYLAGIGIALIYFFTVYRMMRFLIFLSGSPDAAV